MVLDKRAFHKYLYMVSFLNPRNFARTTINHKFFQEIGNIVTVFLLLLGLVCTVTGMRSCRLCNQFLFLRLYAILNEEMDYDT